MKNDLTLFIGCKKHKNLYAYAGLSEEKKDARLG